MPEKVEGIVLDSLRFKENSVIAKIFIKDYGLVSILINGLGAKKYKSSLVYLQPLTHIECQLYFKDNRSINKVTDITVINSPFGLANNVVKSSISVFIAEIVLRTSKDSFKDNNVFMLLEGIVGVLSSEKSSITSLHLYFTIKYLEVLGFNIERESTKEYFKGESFLEIKLTQLLNLQKFAHVEMNKNEKKKILNYLLFRLRLNLGMFDLQSYKILEEVML